MPKYNATVTETRVTTIVVEAGDEAEAEEAACEIAWGLDSPDDSFSQVDLVKLDIVPENVEVYS